MNIREKIEKLIEQALESLGVPRDMVSIVLDHPTDEKFGDYSTNVALLLSKQLGASTKNPVDLAQKIVEKIKAEISTDTHSAIINVEIAGPGFINFYLSPSFFREAITEALDKTMWYGKNTKLWNKKIIIEHTNLNPFKPFHIGHIVNNSIGESISRVLEFQDVKLTRASYGGDVGMHVAKTVWGVLSLKHEIEEVSEPRAIIEFLGKAYVLGTEKFDTDPKIQEEIRAINIKIFEGTDPEINSAYDWGKKASLEYFQEIYKRLDTRFDVSFLESEVADEGTDIVRSWLERGVFVESEGAIIFPGEKYGLHNRVFLSSQGLPTYEAKELGLTKRKFELHDFNQSIVITANEQNDYFAVILEAIKHIYPEVANRTLHIGHGIMRFASGKMSSRKGNVVLGETLIQDIEAMVLEKMHDQEFTDADKKEIAEKVAIGAIKYSILKQSIGKDIIFDPEKSISFEGDSGPYIQYTYVRTRSIMAKAKEVGIEAVATVDPSIEITRLEKMVYKFPEIVERAAHDMAPNYIATYVTELASEFNAYYAKNKIVDPHDPLSSYRLGLTEAVGWVLKNSLHLLGIQTPERM